MTRLGELVRHLALLGASRPYSMTVRLMEGQDGTRIELRASRAGTPGVEEYARQMTLAALERDGPRAVAEGFARHAAVALASGSRPA